MFWNVIVMPRQVRLSGLGFGRRDIKVNNKLDISNYWDDFERRVRDTVECINNNCLPRLDRLTVHITEKCNFRCGYCNMNFTKREMPVNTVIKIINDYAQLGKGIIHFTGGEPTIHPYFEEMCAWAKEKGLTVSANTNAFKKVETQNIDKLKLSFDTPIEDVFNKTVNHALAFKTVVENIKAYSEEMKGKVLSITAVLNSKTYKNMLQLAEFINDNFDIYNLYYSNYKGCNGEFAFSDEQIQDMFNNHIPEVLTYFKNTNNIYSQKQLSLYEPNDFINSDIRFKENKIIPCYIQLSEMTVDVNGNCFNCSHLFRDGVPSKINVNVNDMPLRECFEKLKNNLGNNYTCLSSKCLSGCNKNLIGFNKEVNSQIRKVMQ